MDCRAEPGNDQLSGLRKKMARHKAGPAWENVNYYRPDGRMSCQVFCAGLRGGGA
jgi:hypothetical protein